MYGLLWQLVFYGLVRVLSLKDSDRFLDHTVVNILNACWFMSPQMAHIKECVSVLVELGMRSKVSVKNMFPFLLISAHGRIPCNWVSKLGNCCTTCIDLGFYTYVTKR